VSDPIEAPDRTALLMAVMATVGLSLKGIFGKFAFIAGASVMTLVLVRMLLALPLFWAADRLLRAEARTPMSRRDIGLGLCFGAMFLVAMLTDFTAIDRLGAGLSRIALFTYPLIVVLISSAMDRHWPSGRQLTAFVISYGGLLIVLRPDRAELPPLFWSGVGFALLCAITIGAVYALANPLIKRIGAARFSIITHLSAAIGMCLIAMMTFTHESFAIGRDAYLWIALIVIVATVGPMLMQYEAMRRIGASRVSLIALIGPIVTVTLAWFLLDEHLGAIQIVGFVLVLCGIVVLEWPSLHRSIKG